MIKLNSQKEENILKFKKSELAKASHSELVELILQLSELDQENMKIIKHSDNALKQSEKSDSLNMEIIKNQEQIINSLKQIKRNYEIQIMDLRTEIWVLESPEDFKEVVE